MSTGSGCQLQKARPTLSAIQTTCHMPGIYGDFVKTETRGGVRKGAGEVGGYFIDFPLIAVIKNM